MIDLVSKITLPKPNFKLNYSNRILSLGSCFSENIGNRLQNTAFCIDINPFGVLFNPRSIIQSIERIKQKLEYSDADLFCNADIWGSLQHSTLFSDTDQQECLNKINERYLLAAKNFDTTDLLILTFGTAWTFEHIASAKTVANCHKLPANQFLRYRLTAAEISTAYIELFNTLTYSKPDLKVILTVSPVRHFKDGATENHLSKAILLEAAKQIEQHCHQVCYFPSYEIMLDELRDYRYYANDLMHPSELAVDLIFEKFAHTFFDTDTFKIYEKALKYHHARNHRPLHTNSMAYQKFIKQTQKLKQELSNMASISKNNPNYFD